MSVRKGPTRIPTFGSRIPLPGQIVTTTSSSSSTTTTPQNETIRILDSNRVAEETVRVTSKYREPGKADVGKRAQIGDREGVLRYIGNVHFAAGTWCGIEVTEGTGKNDGSVRGVRYFACPKSCGLMAPLSKVFVAEDGTEDASGPYSMLFGINETKTIIRSRTFDKIEIKEDSYKISNVTFNKDNLNESADSSIDHEENEDDLNKTVVSNPKNGRRITALESTFVKLQETFVQKRNFVLENLVDYNSPLTACFTHNLRNFSTPVTNLDVEASPRKVRQSPSHIDDEINKRDSLEFEESLGILTPDQMIDVSGLVGSRTPSSENIRLLPHDELSPKLESSIKEFSLGLIDEHILSALTMKTDAMNLPLDSHNDPKCLARIEQTPSPEELPLDPTPMADSKGDQNKKSPNSFITSITSITSLDTGYQGDGEMSRPASRGADTSPLTRRPQPRPPPRRPDPMTDSDFYTESDADNHEDHPLRGDRRAQVIDGTLYGVDPQAAADIYANNRENMDSSGIFTDIERADELSSADNEVHHMELSPSDSSTKTISDDSQNHVNLIANKTPTNDPADRGEPTTPMTPSPNSTLTSSPASTRSPRHLPKSKEDLAKKYKMPKRNVASKVKAMIEPNNKENEKRQPAKKVAGRWDAVMNKISKGPQEIKNLKEVKSKVFSSITGNVQRNAENTKLSPSQKSPNNKLRRVRTRANTTPNKGALSINSSLSDLSGASPAKTTGSAKKQRDVVRVTQVLTAAKLSPKSNNSHSIGTEASIVSAKNKTNTGLNNETKPNNRNLFSPKEKKKEQTKEIGRATVKGGRVSPATRPPQQPRTPLKPPAPRTAEALAVLVQHLVFNLEAFKNPCLKKEVERVRLHAEEARLSCRQLEETLIEEKRKHVDTVKDERIKCRAEIAQLIERQRNEMVQIKLQQQESEKIFEAERDAMRGGLAKQHEEQMRALKFEFDKLQKTQEESLDILREENDAIREAMDEKSMRIKELEQHRLESERQHKEQLAAADDEIRRLRCENEAHFIDACGSGGGGGDNSYQEVQSLRAVLELKQRDFADLRKALAEASQKADQLPAAEEKIAALMAKCEDMQHQLERKNECELQLLSENKKLHDSFIEEMNQKKRIYQHNEELQWKLQQNKEVVTKVLEEAEATALNRSMLSASFNERHSATIQRPNFERALSCRERSLSNKSTASQGSDRSRKSKNSFDIDLEDLSPPSSPKVKGVVEKSDSVSYVLEMDESPEVVASRIVRRSFRNATPPKNTPTKSPANKRPRMKNNLSLSSSTSAIVSGAKVDHLRSRSASVRNGDDNTEDIFVYEMQATSSPNAKKYEPNYWSSHGDFDEDDEDIKLPSLPSEIGRKHINTLPVPKHLAGEAMISESNSEDECSTSSSSGQL